MRYTYSCLTSSMPSSSIFGFLEGVGIGSSSSSCSSVGGSTVLRFLAEREAVPLVAGVFLLALDGVVGPPGVAGAEDSAASLRRSF